MSVTERRPTRYSPTEDAIILSTAHTAAEETNRQLREAGFEERSPNAIKVRRHYLQHRVPKPTTQEDKDESALTAALVKRKRLTAELAANEQAQEQIKSQLAEVNAVIHGLLAKLKDELES